MIIMRDDSRVTRWRYAQAMICFARSRAVRVTPVRAFVVRIMMAKSHIVACRGAAESYAAACERYDYALCCRHAPLRSCHDDIAYAMSLLIRDERARDDTR